METEKLWYYASNGESSGPFSYEKMIELIKSKTVNSETKVWNGEGDWKKAEETELKEILRNENPLTPPPLPASEISNAFIWIVALIPVIGMFIEIAIEQEILLGYFIANVLFCLLDERKLTKAGHKTPDSWLVIIIPVYLWQRATILKQKRSYFWVWIIGFIFSFLVEIELGVVKLEEQACRELTSIMQTELHQDARCSSVTIDEDLEDDSYTAIAILDDGREIKLIVTENEDGTVSIKINGE